MKIFILVFLALFLGTQVLAAGLVPCGGGPARCCEPSEMLDPAGNGCVPLNPPSCEYRCQICHFFVMGKNIIDTLLLKIIPPLAVLFVIIGGTYFILGSGYDPALISKAKAMFWAVGVGLLIIYGSWLAVNLFFTVIGVSDWTGLSGGWWQINCSSTPPASMMIPNLNQQAAVAGQPQFFIGVNQPAVDEDIPLPPF